MYYLEHIEERSILINNSVCPLLRLRWSICQCLVLVDIERKIAAFKVLRESLVVVEVVVVVAAARGSKGKISVSSGSCGHRRHRGNK
mgnify:CR=1 FL=1